MLNNYIHVSVGAGLFAKQCVNSPTAIEPYLYSEII